MKISYNNLITIKNYSGMEFKGIFVGTIEYVTYFYDNDYGYDFEVDYGLAFKLESGEIVRANHYKWPKDRFYLTSLKGCDYRIMWDVYSDLDNIPEEYRATIEFEPVAGTEKFVAVETNELPF